MQVCLAHLHLLGDLSFPCGPALSFTHFGLLIKELANLRRNLLIAHLVLQLPDFIFVFLGLTREAFMPLLLFNDVITVVFVSDISLGPIRVNVQSVG